MKRKIALAALCLALAGALPLQRGAAAAEEATVQGYALGEVVVSGKHEGVEASESVYTVTAEDIKNKDARTLDQALSLLPGVNIRTGAEGVPRIDIRGFRTRHVVLLLDGIPLNSAFDQQFDPTIIPTENIAEIKLTAGASSTLYGQGGLGGVINIITKKGSKGVHGSVSAETGDHAPYLVRGTLGGGTEKFDYFLSASSTKVNAFPLSDDFRPTQVQGPDYRSNSDRDRHNFFGSLGFSPNKDLTLGLTVGLSQGSFGKPASAINNPYDIFASPPKYERIDDFTGVSAQLAADYQITEQLSIRGWVFINQLMQHDNLYDNGAYNSFNLVKGSFQEHVDTSVMGVSLQPKYDMGKWGVITLALAREWDSWKNEGLQTVSTAPYTFGSLNADQSLGIYSAGVEYEFSPFKGLGLVAGYGHYWQRREEINQNDFSILAGAHYDITDSTRVKASFKRNVRFPSLGDLYDLTQGNPNLVSERAYTYEGGVEQKLPRKSVVSLTGFHSNVKNLIQNNQAAGQNMNLAKVRFTGFEIAAATQFIEHLLLRASYTYLDSEDRSRAGREQQQYSPGDKLTVEGKYDFACGFSPYVSLVYVGDQYFYTKNNITPAQKARLDDYTLVNVKLSQNLAKNRVTLYFGVDNIFDANYETSYGFPQAGRFIYGGVEFRM